MHANLIGRRESEIAIAALFRSDDKNTVYSVCNNGPKGWFVPIIMDYVMRSDTIDEIVISVRITNYAMNGRKDKTVVFNQFKRAMTSSLTVEEYL